MNRNINSNSTALFLTSTLLACISSYYAYRYLFKSSKKYKGN